MTHGCLLVHMIDGWRLLLGFVIRSYSSRRGMVLESCYKHLCCKYLLSEPTWFQDYGGCKSHRSSQRNCVFCCSSQRNYLHSTLYAVRFCCWYIWLKYDVFKFLKSDFFISNHEHSDTFNFSVFHSFFSMQGISAPEHSELLVPSAAVGQVEGRRRGLQSEDRKSCGRGPWEPLQQPSVEEPVGFSF